MTDYDKLKSFAEELNPGLKTNHHWFHHRGKKVYYHVEDEPRLDVYGKDGEEFGIYINGYSSSHTAELPIDQWIKETREYWREQGLPSLQGKRNNNLIIDELSPIDWSKFYSPRYLGHGMIEEYFNDIKEKPVYKSIWDDKILLNLTDDQIKNGIKDGDIINHKTNKKSIMKNIKDTIKKKSLSKDNKELFEAGMINLNKEFSQEVRDYALEQLIEEKLEDKEFIASMVEIAKERNKECK